MKGQVLIGEKLVSFELKPGESTATTIYCESYRERLRFAWHFFKVALSFVKPNNKKVTSNIIQGPIPPSSRP